MKKGLLVLCLMTIFLVVSKASEVSYSVSDDAVNTAISNAIEMSLSEAVSIPSPIPFASNDAAQISSKNGWAAVALCFFLGGIGVHRHYLGTSGMMWFYYLITCGGVFGIVTLVDFVVLIIGSIDNNVRQYENNDSFIMWK